MRTPAGKDCPHFYGNYFRGREEEQCRLLGANSLGARWKPELCKTCPVPDILRANACQHMILTPRLARSLPLLRQIVRVNAFCRKSGNAGFDPHVGCGQCHPLPEVFRQLEEK